MDQIHHGVFAYIHLICVIHTEWTDGECLKDGHMYSTSASNLSTSLYFFFFFLLIFFCLCLRGTQPCTIKSVRARQTLVCLLFCCWLPPTDVHVDCCCTCCIGSLMCRQGSPRQMFEDVLWNEVLGQEKEKHFEIYNFQSEQNHRMARHCQ